MKREDFEAQAKVLLKQKPTMSPEADAVLFARADILLEKRRELISLREAHTEKTKQARQRRIVNVRQSFSSIFDLFAIYPDAPAAAATFAVLVLTFVALHTRNEGTTSLSSIELPALPTHNDFPARYDAQIRAERLAYEREVEDAHQRTSGGI